MALNILVVGGSRHIGYHASLRFLDAGATVTFLMRSPAAFDADENVQKHIKAGKAKLFKGDALIPEDARNAWAAASADQPVDVLLFTVGFTGSPGFSVTKGFTMSPPDLVTKCLLNLLCEMPKSTSKLPKVVVLSTIGVSASSRSRVSLPLKVMYGYLIKEALRDKLGMERVIAHSAGWEWNTSADGEPSDEIMGKGWKEREGLPAPGTLDAVVIRAALLNDEKCVADTVEAGKKPYKIAKGEDEVKGWFISREDVAHFAVDLVTNQWEELGGGRVSISY